MKKHLNVLPSVVVVFADIDWTDPDTRAVVSTVARVRQLLTGRLTKVVVVLLQTDTSTPTDSVMTALCTVWSLIQGNLLQERGRRLQAEWRSMRQQCKSLPRTTITTPRSRW